MAEGKQFRMRFNGLGLGRIIKLGFGKSTKRITERYHAEEE